MTTSKDLKSHSIASSGCNKVFSHYIMWMEANNINNNPIFQRKKDYFERKLLKAGVYQMLAHSNQELHSTTFFNYFTLT